MDSRATLAIAAIVRSVVDTADSKVAVLASPEGVPPERFKALSGFAETAGGTNALFQLARLVNQRVTPPVVDDDISMSLWSLVHDILKRSGKPGSHNGGTDDPEYQEARKLIFVDDGSGIAQPSPAYLAYQQMRDQWFCLQQDVGAKKLELSLKPPNDPGRAPLQELITKLLRDIEDFELRWEGEQRTRIERAVQIVSAFNARSPQRQWSKWQDMLSPFVKDDTGEGAQTDIISQARFAATAISPAGIDELSSTWTKMSMTGAEIDTLVEDLPTELAARFNPTGAKLQIDRLDFEWTTAGIVRPWLDRAVFGDRGWCFQDPARLVSDGGDPPVGEWPYLATGIVFVRGVKTAFRESPPTPHVRRDLRDVVAGHALFGRRLRHESFAAPPDAGTALTAEPVTAVVERRALKPQFARGRFFEGGVAHTATASVVPQQPAFAMLRERAFIRHAKIADGIVAATATTPDTPADAVPEPIMIFGLICSRLPRSPNPDPALFA